MINEEGVEVYLKPIGPDGKVIEGLRLPEVELKPQNDYDGCYRNCFVPFIDEPFMVVIRYPADFPMHSASAMHIGIKVTGVRDGEILQSWWVYQRSFIPGQQSEYATHQGLEFKMVKVDESSFPLSREKSTHGLQWYCNYDDVLNPGAVTVILRRGKVIWKDENVPRDMQSIFGPGNPAGRRPFRNSTFEHIEGRPGSKYRFEFRGRSHARLCDVDNLALKHAGEPPLSEAQRADKSRYDMQADHEFIRERSRTKEIEAQMSRDFIEKGKLPEVLTVDPGAKAVDDNVRCKPQTCDCPKEQHPRSGPNINAPSEIDGDTFSEPKPRGQGRSSAGAAESETLSSGVKTRQPKQASNKGTESGNQKGETEAVLCQSCHKYKPPRKGRKLAWRQRTGRWMSVHADAPEEEPPQIGVEDDCDEERLVRSKAQTKSQAVGGDETAALSNETILSPKRSVSHAGEQSLNESHHDGEMQTPDQQFGRQAAAEASEMDPGLSTSQSETLASTLSITSQGHQNSSNADRSLHIDLTAEGSDDKDLVVIKSAKVASCHRKGKSLKDHDDESLRKRLESVVQQKRMLKLDEEEAEIELELEARAKRRATGSLKLEVKPEIKLED